VGVSGSLVRSLSEEFRARSEADYALIAQRVSWLILSQSFLFIAYTAALVARPPNTHSAQVRHLLHVFPLHMSARPDQRPLWACPA
jgi:hypothetical protein